MWQGRRVIVAGGTAGFGLVLGRHLARAGARVLLVGRSGEGVRRASGPASRMADGAIRPWAHGRPRDAGEGDRTAAEAIRILGGIDDVFCCVGRSGRATILATDRQTLQRLSRGQPAGGRRAHAGRRRGCRGGRGVISSTSAAWPARS